jgi:hypothetical protein
MWRVGIVLFVVGLTVSGCLGSGGATSTIPEMTAGLAAPHDHLAVTVTLGSDMGLPITHHYLLTCDPAGGTMPRPRAACAAIGDYLRRGRPVSPCFGVLDRSTVVARLTGNFQHHRLALAFGPNSWCGESSPVMRDLWTLSTFPCSTIVIHTQNIRPYSRFARVTGCEGPAK